MKGVDGAHLLRPATRIWREGHSLERAVAVDPPTRPVPPRTRTREFSGLQPLFAGEAAVAVASRLEKLGRACAIKETPLSAGFSFSGRWLFLKVSHP